MSITRKHWSPRQALNKAVGAVVHWISLNQVDVDSKVVVKRRNRFGRLITPAANWFFGWCRAPIIFWKDVRAWQQWEVNCFRMLHPQNQASIVGEDAVRQDRLPGVSIWDHLHKGTLTP